MRRFNRPDTRKHLIRSLELYKVELVSLAASTHNRLGRSSNISTRGIIKGQLEWETMKWLHWHNKAQLHGATGQQTPCEMEDTFRQQQNELAKAAQMLNKKTLRKTSGDLLSFGYGYLQPCFGLPLDLPMDLANYVDR